ncbi:hypothetical protein GCM10010517_11640 [Streptosporangium fragile]|uniref:Condensation domain-containing protein n=1 Tax=Streptosporangium fragile TaxID=46186 RepID=A0ABP6I7Y9_9ACTN
MFHPETVPTGRTETEYPLSHDRQRLWFLDRLALDDSTYNTSYVYRVKCSPDTAAPEAAPTAVAARHESLRTRFPEVAGAAAAVEELLVAEPAGLSENEATRLVATGS